MNYETVANYHIGSYTPKGPDTLLTVILVLKLGALILIWNFAIVRRFEAILKSRSVPKPVVVIHSFPDRHALIQPLRSTLTL